MPQVFDIIREPRDRKKDALMSSLLGIGNQLGSSIAKAGQAKQKKADTIEVNQAAQADALEAKLIQDQINAASADRIKRQNEASTFMEAAKSKRRHHAQMQMHPELVANPEKRSQLKSASDKAWNTAMADPRVAEFFPEMVMNEKQLDEQWLSQTTKRKTSTGQVGKSTAANLKDEKKRKGLMSVLDSQLSLGEQRASGNFEESALNKFSKLTHQRSDLDISPHTTGVPEIPSGLPSGADRFSEQVGAEAEALAIGDPFNPLNIPAQDPSIAAKAGAKQQEIENLIELGKLSKGQAGLYSSVTQTEPALVAEQQRAIKAGATASNKAFALLNGGTAENTPESQATKEFKFNTKAMNKVNDLFSRGGFSGQKTNQPAGEFDNVDRPSNGFNAGASTSGAPANKAEFTQTIQDIESLMGAGKAQEYFEKFGSMFK